MNKLASAGDPRQSGPKLIPALGLFSAIMLVAGGVIGSGIFRKPGVMAAQIGSPELLLVVWLLAGVVSLLGALSNAELASMMPHTGGQYLFLQRAYGPFVSFLYGWALFAVIQSGSIAALAYVFAEYSTRLVPLPDAPGSLAQFAFHLPLIGDIAPFRELGIKGLAAAVIIILTIVNYLGVRFGGVVQNVFSVAKMGAMVGLAVVVVLTPGIGSISNLVVDSAVVRPTGLALWAAMAAAMQGRVLGLRWLAQNHLHRRRIEIAPARPPSQPDRWHSPGRRTLSPHERDLFLRAAHR